MKKACLLVCVVALALSPLSVLAKKDKPIVKAQNKEDFAVVVAAVQQEMRPGGRFEFVTADERATVDAKLGDMTALFDQFGTVDGMNQDAKIALFNAQEKVNGILTRRDGDRLVCERTPPLGTNIPRTTCKTYREIARARQDNADFLLRMKQAPQPSGGSLSPRPGGR
jgi:hypothetical protein